MTSPVVTSVSHATRPVGSSVSTASSTASEIWSAILSGWPSVTDSEVNRNLRFLSLKPAPLLNDSPGKNRDISTAEFQFSSPSTLTCDPKPVNELSLTLMGAPLSSKNQGLECAGSNMNGMTIGIQSGIMRKPLIFQDY